MKRRQFLQSAAAAAGGLVVAFEIPARAQAPATGGASTNPLKFNAFVKVSPDDTVTFEIHKAEMGQGTVTSLSQILADEMDADWKKIRTEFPGVDPAYGPMMGVYGSLSIRTSYQPLRVAGAQAREMLISAAAQKWSVDRSTLRTESGAVVNAKGERATYGSLAEAASKIAPPANAPLKDPKNFKFIGSSPKRLDTALKVNGTAGFGIDVKQPNMLYASLERCPVFEGKVASFDATKAKAVPGVKNVVQISNGVAVIAENTWAAMEGRKALSIKWDEGPRANNSSAGFRTMFAQMAATPGKEARKIGDAPAALAASTKKISADYEAPFLCHAPMEPMNATAQIGADGVDVWTSCQIQSVAQAMAARIAGVPDAKVRIHTQYLGGGFGRRGGGDFVGEAVEIAKHTNGAPVKLTWTREDDMTHDNYRPASYVKFAAGLGADGLPAAVTASVACPAFGPTGQNGIDGNAVDGIANAPYKFASFKVDAHHPDTGVPCTYWRSVGYSQNTYFMESFVDEMAAAAGQDPVEYRRKLLNSPRAIAVLNLAAEKAEWGKPLPAGRARGVAVVNNIGSFNAIVAEVSAAGGKLKVHRVVCAVDCGVVINPEILRAQMESGVVYGLTTLKTAITINKGRVVETNFHQYEPLRIDDMPKVEVHVVPSTAAPGGIGEASTPTIVPAVTNALAALKKRVRALPVKAADLA